MKITVTRIWVSPSTLHLGLMYGPNSEKWIRFQNVHVPLEAIPFEDLRNLLERDQAQKRDEEGQPVLF